MSSATTSKQSALDSFLNKVLPVIDKIQSNTYVSSVTGGMMGAMTVMMASAIFQLIYAFPVEPWTQLLQSIGLYDLLTTVVNIFNLTAIVISFSIGYTLGGKKDVDAFQSGIAALMAFLIVTPLTVNEGGTFLNTTYLGAQGIFTAMFCGLVAPTLFAVCVKRHIEIKLPDSVPPFVSRNLGPIPSALITVIPFVALRGLFGMTEWGSFTDFIYAIIQVPLTGVGNTITGHIILIAFTCLLWWCGVHGTLVAMTVATPILSPAMLENLAAYNAGDPVPFLLSFTTFFMVVQFLGGPGCMFGLYINLAFGTKSDRYKAQGKVSLVPGLFNIIEPTVFGLPVVLNPVLFIPFVGLPVIVYLLYYLFASMGIVGVPVLSATVMVLPGPIAGFLLGGGMSLGIFMLAMLLLSVVVYFPFVKILDRQALKEEAALAAAKESEGAAA